jgi:hypothetical protein
VLRFLACARGRPAATLTSTASRWLAVLLLASIFPTVSFMGHWDTIFLGESDDPPSATVWIDYAAEQADKIEHTQHCHEDLSSCVAQPLPAGLGFLITHDDIFFIPPFRFAGQAALAVARLTGRILSPLTPPPRPR